MQRSFILTLMLLSGVTFGCSNSTGSLNAVFGGAAPIETVQDATSVHVFRLKPSGKSHAHLSEYEIASGPVVVPADAVSTLRSILLDTSTYGWDSAKGCMPNYGVRIQFKSGSEEVDVLLCFECDILAVYYNGAPMGGEDFDNARGEILSAIRTLFPDDADIQTLK